MRTALVATATALVVVTVGSGLVRAAPGARTATLIAVGDIASCDEGGDEATARLVSAIPGTLAVLGDAVYENGTAEEFRECYLPAWGRFLPRTRAALGNHEYANGDSDAAAAKTTFGLRGEGWYSYEIGAWHAVVLNSNCDLVACGVGSPQWRWLRADLTRHRKARCTLAYWHHPRFSSGRHGSDLRLAPFWDLLAAARADLVLSGHDHHYERFGPLKGIRSFVVGTGGKSHYEVGKPRAGSQVVSDDTFGVLRVTLRPAGWGWRFVPVAGASFADSGSARCR